jgi:predicted RNA-binding Zn-ribbon protein involved in translation (DUF1610 family)
VTPPTDEYTEPPEDVRREMDRSITLTVTSARTILHTLHHLDEFLRCHASPAVRADLHAFCTAQGWSAACGTDAFLDGIGFDALALRHAIDTTAQAAAIASPSRDDPATTPCPVCQACFTPTGRQRYCSTPCRKTAFRRRHADPATTVVVPDGRPRRQITIYECPDCGQRLLGEQRCSDCGTFARRVGVGGTCPDCDAPVAVEDLLDSHTTITATTGPKRKETP